MEADRDVPAVTCDGRAASIHLLAFAMTARIHYSDYTVTTQCQDAWLLTSAR